MMFENLNWEEPVENDLKVITQDLTNLIRTMEATDGVEMEGLGDWLKGTLIKVSNLATSIVLINKTNIINVLKNIKRSELRAYTDRYLFTVKQVEGMNYTDIMNTNIMLPTGMKKPALEVSEFLKNAYSTLDISAVSKWVLDDSASLYDTTMRATSSEDFAKNINTKKYDGRYKTLNKISEGIVKDHLKLFASDYRETNLDKMTALVTKSIAFKKVYGSMKEMTSYRENLLECGTDFSRAADSVEVSEKVSEHISKLVECIQQGAYLPNKKFVLSIAQCVKTMAMTYDVVSVMLKTQMICEHNLIMNYDELKVD